MVAAITISRPPCNSAMNRNGWLNPMPVKDSDGGYVHARACCVCGGNHFVSGLCVQNLWGYILFGMVPRYLRGNELKIVKPPRLISKMLLRINRRIRSPHR